MEADLDIGQLRADTAGCEQSIFFNNAGASLQPRPVVARVLAHLRLEEQVGGYEAADTVTGELEDVYGSVARLLHCTAEEIALQENATRAWEMAFYSLRFGPGDRIVTAANEYASNYIAFLQVARRTGAEICVVESDATGQVDLHSLEHLLDERVKVIALTHVGTNGGLVQPAAGRGQTGARRKHSLFAGRLSVDWPDASGCGGVGLRYALRDRPQIPARPARHRLSLCAQHHAAGHGTAPARSACRHLD